MSRAQERTLLARLDAARQVRVTCLGQARKRVRLVRESKAFQHARTLPRDDPARKERFREARTQHGFSEYALHAYAQQFGHSWLGAHLDSLTIQSLASRAYRAANQLLLGKARRVRRVGSAPAGHRRGQDQHQRPPLAQARLFVSRLQRRWQTLARITVYLVERQEAFVEQGQEALLPLTRAEVAGALKMHASTVSRAMADKTVLLPSGQVVPFSTFCTANLSVKSVLQELVQQAARPLSDQQLAQQLQTRGITIARRTVAKYRRHLGLPPAHARARAR